MSQLTQQDAKKIRRVFNETYHIQPGQTVNIDGKYLSFYGISADVMDGSLQLAVLGYPTDPVQDALRLPVNIVYKGRNVHLFAREMKRL